MYQRREAVCRLMVVAPPPPTGIEKLGKQANGGTPPPSTPRYPHMYQEAAEADKSWYPPPPTTY